MAVCWCHMWMKGELIEVYLDNKARPVDWCYVDYPIQLWMRQVAFEFFRLYGDVLSEEFQKPLAQRRSFV